MFALFGLIIRLFVLFFAVFMMSMIVLVALDVVRNGSDPVEVVKQMVKIAEQYLERGLAR
ncbi:hypothetical protein [Vibrio owensii]|uniref:hypothetical protein n=1 Tax=Vibrio owensii TaxID=696485 RepID=UPI0018F22D61|nr:hypothetical protein [Vibrio owensii]